MQIVIYLTKHPCISRYVVHNSIHFAKLSLHQDQFVLAMLMEIVAVIVTQDKSQMQILKMLFNRLYLCTLYNMCFNILFRFYSVLHSILNFVFFYFRIWLIISITIVEQKHPRRGERKNKRKNEKKNLLKSWNVLVREYFVAFVVLLHIILCLLLCCSSSSLSLCRRVVVSRVAYSTV